MFGVLLAARADGTRVCLRAFSGMLDGQWVIEGFVPPMFDRAAREAIEVPGEARVKALSAEHALLAERIAASPVAHELERMRLRHESNRSERKRKRAAGVAPEGLDQESRADKAEKRRYLASDVALQLARDERRLKAVTRVRRMLSASLMQQIHGTYVVRNSAGEQRDLRSLYAPSAPPSGAGDCAAPKLLAAAFAQGLRPLELVEMFYGVGSRQSGERYPPCPNKCGPLLAFMAPEFLPAAAALSPTIVFEDDWIVVLEKPSGCLSVPGKRLDGSALSWLRERFPEALLAHRLDEDTSGLLVAGKTQAAYVALQRQFAERTVEKHYSAWVEGDVRGSGVIDLPLRADVENRPRQVHDPIHGRIARTEWQATDHVDGFSRLRLSPLTGRTHQLRVHTAVGLGAPIVGDRLYGTADERLLLHAEALAFDHPHDNRRMLFQSAPPF